MAEDKKTDRDDQFMAAEVENVAAGHGNLSQAELDELVASSDTGARTPPGFVGKFILAVALAWSIFQLWYASPIPYIIGWGVLNSSDARSFHLAFALFLAFAVYPASRTPVQLFLGVGVPALLTGLFIYGGRARHLGLVDRADRAGGDRAPCWPARPRTASRSGSGGWRSRAPRPRSTSSSSTTRSPTASARRSCRTWSSASSA